MRIVTLSEREMAEADRRTRAAAELCCVLTDYARAHGGRFLLFGSAARGTMRYHSDVDILVDFQREALDDACGFAERACWDRKLDPDIMPYAWCTEAFLKHIAPEVQVMG
ncbi:MAG: nucleotidyltransferase family protein [Acetobacteraceae bacterium]